MAVTRLFDSWQIKKDLPFPFNKEVEKQGQARYSTKVEYCSRYNQAHSGKKATLFPAVLKAMLNLMQADQIVGSTAAGIQLVSGGSAAFYCMEYSKEYDDREYDCALVYNPQNGRIKEGVVCGEDYLARETFTMTDQQMAMGFPVSESESTGEELIALFVYASIEKEGPLFDSEFCQHYEALKAMYDQDWKNAGDMMRSAYICCDNLFRRVENGAGLGAAGIPFDQNRYAQGMVDSLSEREIKSGAYSPNKTAVGTFTIFRFNNRKPEYEIADMQAMYGKKLRLSREEEKLVPNLPASYKVGEKAAEILEAVQKTPSRIFMLTGSAGVGKTTDAQIIAQVLGYPYYFFTCGPDSDELSLVASMVPNTRRRANRVLDFPTYEDMQMDPASALKQISGRYQSGIDAEHAFSAILKMAYQRGYQEAKQEKDFVMVESSIIKGCKGPSVIEIQEPSVIERSATLVKLNSLLDDTAAITLLNGEVIHRHPETVVILTTNLNYMGCRNFNESVLSRVQSVQHRGDMTAEQMVQRASRKTGFQDFEMLKKMAEIALEIRKRIHEEEIQGGLCEYREYENWVWSFIAKGNILEAAEDTIIGKASMDESERKEMMDVYVRPHFEDAA